MEERMEKLFRLFLVGFLTGGFLQGQGAAIPFELEENRDYFFKGSTVKLNSTNVVSLGKNPDGPTPFNFEIFACKDNNPIGNIALVWYPNSKTSPHEIVFSDHPFLYIENIYIGTEKIEGEPHHLHKQGYGTMAMQTLFILLYKSKLFPSNTEITLECPTYVSHLDKWYRSLGFEVVTTEGASKKDSQYMSGVLGIIAKANASKVGKEKK